MKRYQQVVGSNTEGRVQGGGTERHQKHITCELVFVVHFQVIFE